MFYYMSFFFFVIDIYVYMYINTFIILYQKYEAKR